MLDAQQIEDMKEQAEIDRQQQAVKDNLKKQIDGLTIKQVDFSNFDATDDTHIEIRIEGFTA